MKRRTFALLAALAALGLGLACPPSASATGGGESSCPNPLDNNPDGVWVETTYDANGQLLYERSGPSTAPPYLPVCDADGQLTDAIPSPEYPEPSAPATSGERTVDWYESGHSLLGALVYRFHQTKHWRWNYPRVTNTSVGTYVSHMDPNFLYRGLVGSHGWYYTWRGCGQGGHYSFRQAWIENCIFHYGCIGSSYPWVKIWINGNGAWIGDDGGGL